MIELIKRFLRSVLREINIQRAWRKLRYQGSLKPFQLHIENVLSEFSLNGVSLIQDRLDDEVINQFAQQAEYEF